MIRYHSLPPPPTLSSCSISQSAESVGFWFLVFNDEEMKKKRSCRETVWGRTDARAFRLADILRKSDDRSGGKVGRMFGPLIRRLQLFQAFGNEMRDHVLRTGVSKMTVQYYDDYDYDDDYYDYLIIIILDGRVIQYSKGRMEGRKKGRERKGKARCL